MNHPTIPLIRTSEVMALIDLIADHIGRETLDLALRKHGFSGNVMSDPSTTMPYAEYVRFLEACARIAGRPLLGAEIGAALRFESIGLYGRYTTSAATLHEALSRAARALKYHESGSALHVEFHERQCSIRYSLPSPRALGSRQQADGVAALMINLVRRYEGPDWHPERVFLDSAQDSRRERLEEFFRCKIIDSKGRIGIVGQVSDPDISLAPTSAVTQPLTWREIRQMVLERPPQSLGAAVQSTLCNLVRDGDFTLSDLSRVFGLTPRTLQRRLSREGLGFGQLLEGARSAYAEELLEKTTMTMSELAERLGYSSRQHFIRAFRSWRGVNPGRFRQNVGPGIPVKGRANHPAGVGSDIAHKSRQAFLR